MQRDKSWIDIPVAVRVPLYFNPLFFLTMAFAPLHELYPEWVTCLVVFVSIAWVSIILTIRNLRKAGEAA